MHALTKVLVVIAAVLAVLLSGLTIAYTANAERIVGELSSARAATAAAVSDAQRAQGAMQSQIDAARDTATRLEVELTDLRRQIETLRQENSALLAETKRLELEQSTHTAQIDQFASLLSAQQELAETRQDEVQRLREKELEFARNEIDYEDEINDLRSELEVARANIRALQEQVAGGGAGRTGDDGRLAGPTVPQNFQARVTDVRLDNDTTLVSINAGSNDQLAPGMELNIAREGSGYIGTIKLQTVDLNESVAVWVIGRGTAREGDLVLPSGI